MPMVPPTPPPQMPPQPPQAMSETSQLLQILIQLVQKQNAMVQQQGQQPPPQTASSSSLNPPGLGGSTTRKLGEKFFRRCVVFSNKTEHWREWQVHFLAAVREESTQLADVMRECEAREVAIDLDDMHPAMGESRRLAPHCTIVYSV